MSNPLFNIQYGLFVITTCDAGKDNGCISNTVAQVTAQPNRISVALNKGNFTTELIQRSGKFTASILSEAADFELFKHFGFQSGRTVDKFDGFKDCRRVDNGTLAITRGTNAFISADVEQVIDLGTHMLFLGPVTEMEVLADVPSATYNYYQQHIDHLALQHLRLRVRRRGTARRLHLSHLQAPCLRLREGHCR